MQISNHFSNKLALLTFVQFWYHPKFKKFKKIRKNNEQFTKTDGQVDGKE